MTFIFIGRGRRTLPNRVTNGLYKANLIKLGLHRHRPVWSVGRTGQTGWPRYLPILTANNNEKNIWLQHIITVVVVVVEHYTYHKSGLTTKSKVSKAHPWQAKSRCLQCRVTTWFSNMNPFFIVHNSKPLESELPWRKVELVGFRGIAKSHIQIACHVSED